LNEDSFEFLVEKGRLLFVVPRRDVRKWAAYVDREAALRPSATRVSVIREHLAALDAKSGTMAGIAGLLLAGCAVVGSEVGPQIGSTNPVVIALFALAAGASGLSAIYAMSSLGVEQPEDAGVQGAAAFEFRLLQRLIYRARNHAWGLRSAQIAALFAAVLATVAAPQIGVLAGGAP
jgi:hypothetical protein